MPNRYSTNTACRNGFSSSATSFGKHKNHLAVFEALRLLQARGITPAIVCTGHLYDDRQPDYCDTILQAIQTSGLAEVFLLGLTPKSDQMQLLRRAIALIQPSLFEGWSTVVEDARCLGKPMILSDFPVHLEQQPPHSSFFERTSADALAGLMATYWDSLSPGPDLERESVAWARNREEIVSFAREFLRIAGLNEH